MPQKNNQKTSVINIGENILVIPGWEWKEVSPGDPNLIEPDEGKKFIAVEVLAINQSKESVLYTSPYLTLLKDETGKEYLPDLFAMEAIKGTSFDGEIPPGERIRGKVGFQVPENVQGLQFIFNQGILIGNTFVKLGEMPVSIEPPAKIDVRIK